MSELTDIKKEIKTENIDEIKFKSLMNNKNNYIISLYSENENINYYVLSIDEFITLFKLLNIKFSLDKLFNTEIIKSFILTKSVLYL